MRLGQKFITGQKERKDSAQNVTVTEKMLEKHIFMVEKLRNLRTPMLLPYWFSDPS